MSSLLEEGAKGDRCFKNFPWRQMRSRYPLDDERSINIDNEFSLACQHGGIFLFSHLLRSFQRQTEASILEVHGVPAALNLHAKLIAVPQAALPAALAVRS